MERRIIHITQQSEPQAEQLSSKEIIKEVADCISFVLLMYVLLFYGLGL